MIKVGFTGTQDGMTVRQEAGLMVLARDSRWHSFHHGCCTGADEEAHYIVWEANDDTLVILHPPLNQYKMMPLPPDYEVGDIRKPLDFLDRNQAIVDEVDILIAAPKEREEQLRSGTWATVRRARKKGIPVIILEP